MTIKRVPYPPALRRANPSGIVQSSEFRIASGQTNPIDLARYLCDQSQAVTIVGSYSINQAVASPLNLFVRARIGIRRGQVWRYDEMPWPACGFIRRAVAEEAVLTVTFPTSLPTIITIGGSIVEGILPSDRVVVGAPSDNLSGLHVQYAPLGAARWRVIPGWLGAIVPAASTATVQLVSRTPDPGVPSYDGPLYPVAALADWQPWPAGYAGFSYQAPDATIEYGNAEFET